jgi:RHS repeat-associated protein
MKETPSRTCTLPQTVRQPPGGSRYSPVSDPENRSNMAAHSVSRHSDETPSGHTSSTQDMDNVMPKRVGVAYYVYRWYDPLTGRWPSRDLIGERGGLSMYAFVSNMPLNHYDVLGLWKSDPNVRVPRGVRNTIVCDGDGHAIPYLDPTQFRSAHKGGVTDDCCKDCLTKHEQSHADDANKSPNICEDASGKPLKAGTHVVMSNRKEQIETELKAHKIETKCFEELIAACGVPKQKKYSKRCCTDAAKNLKKSKDMTTFYEKLRTISQETGDNQDPKIPLDKMPPFQVTEH